MTGVQSPILAPVARAARFLTLGLSTGANVRDALTRLSEVELSRDCVLGIGEPLCRALGVQLPGLSTFPALAAPGVPFPSTQSALWLQCCGEDQGAALQIARHIVAALGGAFRLDEDINAFRYGSGRDLSDYEDGTENPQAERAVAAAIVNGRGPGLDGGSFVAVQRYVHDLVQLERMSGRERDFVIGRSRETNEELEDAPASAHVKRSAQESFNPPAFMVRRSMPWGDVLMHGLYFVAFVAELDRFERVLTRMAGLEDGIVDGLFQFSRPVTGGYYFCPPLRGSRLDLRCLAVG